MGIGGSVIFSTKRGSGMSADAYHFTAPHPEGLGAKHAMEDAMKEAGISPDQVDYINTHGTSTPAGDIPELIGIQGAIGDRIYEANLSSTKSMTGHLLGGAGGVEAVFTALALRDQFAPPTIHYEQPDPECDLDYVPNVGREMKMEYALSNSLGFGGHNACLAFKKWEG